MKRLFLFLPLFFFFACSSDTSKRLMEISSRIYSSLDSVSTTLDEIKLDYNSLGEYDKALFGLLYFQTLYEKEMELTPMEYIDFSIDYFNKSKNYRLLAYSYLYKAKKYEAYFTTQYDEYNSCIIKSLEASQRVGKDDLLKGLVHAELGLMCHFQKEYKLASDNYLLAENYLRKTDRANELAKALIGAGNTLVAQGKNDDAFEYFSQALEISTESKVTNAALLAFGSNYYSLKQFDWAHYYLTECLNYPSFKKNEPVIQHLLAEVHFNKNEFQKAIEYANHALSIANNYLDKMNCYSTLTNAQSNIDIQSGKVVYYLNKFHEYGDSVNLAIYSPKVIQETSSLQSQQLISKANNFNWILTSIILAVLLISGGIIFFVRRKAKIKHQEAEEFKTQLHENKIQIKEDLKKEIENTRIKYQNERKNMSGVNRIKLEKTIYNEVLHLDDEDYFFKLMNKTLNRLPDKLKASFPQINSKEIIWCCLFCLDIPLQEIATLLDYSPSSIYKVKQRLAKKMELEGAKELDLLLEEFLNT